MLLVAAFTRGGAIGDNAGHQYFLGQGYYILKDYQEAAKLWRKAAEQGHAESQYFLGELYYQGKGVEQDYTNAYMWVFISVENGYNDANGTLNSITKVLDNKEVETAQNKARQLVEQNVFILDINR